MFPIIFRFGPITIYSLGFFLFLAVILASFLVWKRAREKGLAEEKVFDTFLLTIFLAIVGGRLGYVFSHWHNFSVDFSRILLFGHYPGISFQSAFIFGLLTAMLVSRALELDSLMLMDMFTMAFSWSAVLGTVGCLLDGCLIKPISIWIFGVYFLILAIILTQLYRLADRSVKYADLTRRPGFFLSAYLIFFTLSLLIVPTTTGLDEKILYLALLFISTVLFMIKFPANVLSQIKDHLETRSKEAEENLKDLKKEDPFEDNSRLLDRASDDSEAQSKFGHERAEALRQQLQTVLVQTRKALTKIKIGKYGICESCGKMIDTDRLAAMPTATKCLACEKRREK